MPTSQEFIEMDHKYGAHNYHPLEVVVSKAEGCWVWDPEGKKYLDCLSAYSSQNTGHCHPKIVKAAEDQLKKGIAVTSRAFCNDQMGPYLKKLCGIVGPHLNDPKNSGIMALPMNTGAEAVETALKVARAWGYIKKKIPKDQAKIIVCADNFHGRTITIVGFSTDTQCGNYYGNFGPYTPGFEIIEYGKAQELEDHILKLGPENVAAFLFEPIQGEAGVKVPALGYYTKVREICTKYNVLMIADEIQSGLCRTGKLFTVDYEEVKPDMFCLGKALGGGIYPVSAIVTNVDVVGPDVIKPGTHGSTFGGNSLACAIATASLDVLIDEKLAERATELGAYFQEELKKIAAKGTKLPVKDIRGRGLLIAIEFEGNAHPFVQQFKEHGVLAKDTHETTIRFAPPLVITKEELDWALEQIEKVIVA
ncbi:MAG: ornithine--oxo-acid transaminase [Promethearchaeota archaeon]